ncbi:hypothetical protein GE09DRAFT_1223451 [Coniochaeta sp. 2T2.1]|nr:hypothetical protein GE09DRAFT_1223451 [Coniochaeta sp. 2T2.1]
MAPCRETRLDEPVLAMSTFEAKKISRSQALVDETFNEMILEELAMEPVETQIRQPLHNDNKHQAVISETLLQEEIEAKIIHRIDSEVDLTSTVQRALVVTPDRTYPTAHTSLNHIDWKSVEYNFCLPELPWVTGREMAGVGGGCRV